VTTAVAPDTSAIRAADRCDRCGAQAFLRAELPGGGVLLFCGHHGKMHAEALRAAAINVIDETNRLHKTPASAPDGDS
jgi:hypothetical protein